MSQATSLLRGRRKASKNAGMKSIKTAAFAACLVCAFGALSALGAGENPIAEKIRAEESAMWERFFLPKTNLFYECLSSYDPATCQNHLPTADEVKRQFPNPCGYATGMEDCAIIGGTVLAALCDKHKISPQGADAARAKNVAFGLLSLVQSDGFVARGICPEDGESFYISSSIDQYTHLVHGLWKFYKSPMASGADKAKIRSALVRIAERLERNVKPENDFCSLRADGKPDPLRISRFTAERPHAAARLPMIYAAAWDASGGEKFFALYKKYIDEALDVSERLEINGWTPIWSLLQMQISLELLREVEKDAAEKNRIGAIMEKVARLSLTQAGRVEKKFRASKLDTLYGDWRNPPKWETRGGYNIPKLGTSREVWRAIRETGELPLIFALSPSPDTPPEIKNLFLEAVQKTDPAHCASCGIIFHFCAYWSFAARGKTIE